MDERNFWIAVRQALLEFVWAIDARFGDLSFAEARLSERSFWFLVRRALLSIVRAIESHFQIPRAAEDAARK